MAAAAAWALATGAWAQAAPAPSTAPDGPPLQASPALQPLPRGEAARTLPIIVQARELSGRPEIQTQAEGDAELRRGSLLIRADRLSYDHAEDLAVARGNVRIAQDGNTYTGPELQLRIGRFEGFFVNPTYFFSRTGAGGTAERIDFIDDQRAVATGATYTSCLPDGGGAPDWLLSTKRVRMDFDQNEGIAEGAVLRFMGVPILAAPVLSFPLTDERKSGWLPPSLSIDSKSGFQVSAPYYWNIAPNRDATFTPGISLRRGPFLGSEFRYLEPRYSGKADLQLMPRDQVAGRSRYALDLSHDHALPYDGALSLRMLRVSDDDYWKDFSRSLPTIAPRLLSADLQASAGFGDWKPYARVLRWQVLQDKDALIAAPYDRLPQIGVRTRREVGPGLAVEFEGEFNRFANPSGELVTTSGADASQRPTGTRVHALASVSRPWITPGWSVTPKLSLNAASYSLDAPLDGRSSMSRVIPTASVDSAWVLERDTHWFGRDWRQTLEPRLLYVYTPFRDQTGLPNFDAAAKDFNFDSIFTPNAFSGIDRVSDANQLTAGVTTRVLDPSTGGEALRLGIVQRFLFSDQRLTPSGTPSRQRFSDLLLLGSSNLIPNWWLDATLQYSASINRTLGSVLTARYSPGPFRTVSATYRFSRGATEQIELGWQWPLYGNGPLPGEKEPAPSLWKSGSQTCGGTWYGVGRVSYSTRDRRLTDSIVGFEYDAGCWIGRVVAERQSTGSSQATTRLMFQLELVGLSRLGSNPLQTLKDNIPGYRLLRDSVTTPVTKSVYE